MTEVILFRPAPKRRETKRTTADRLIPRLLGVCATHVAQEESARARLYRCGKLDVVEQTTHNAPVILVTVRHAGGEVIRFNVNRTPDTFGEIAFDGWAHVLKQRRGEWETLVDAIDGPAISPADFVKHWRKI